MQFLSAVRFFLMLFAKIQYAESIYLNADAINLNTDGTYLNTEAIYLNEYDIILNAEVIYLNEYDIILNAEVICLNFYDIILNDVARNLNGVGNYLKVRLWRLVFA